MTQFNRRGCCSALHFDFLTTRGDGEVSTKSGKLVLPILFFSFFKSLQIDDHQPLLLRESFDFPANLSNLFSLSR